MGIICNKLFIGEDEHSDKLNIIYKCSKCGYFIGIRSIYKKDNEQEFASYQKRQNIQRDCKIYSLLIGEVGEYNVYEFNLCETCT